MVRIEEQINILRNIFKLQDELKHIDDEETSCLSMAIQRAQLKPALQKKLNHQKVKYYSLADDREFMDTLTEDHYENEMKFYEHVLPKNFNNTNERLFEKIMEKSNISNFHEDDNDSFEFQEMALNYLESTNKKNIGDILLKKNFSSIFDEKTSSGDLEDFKDKIVSCYNSNQDTEQNLCLQHDKKVRFINSKKNGDKKKIIVSKDMIKPKENIATDSGKILETEANQILNVDSEKIFGNTIENQSNLMLNKFSNVLNRKGLVRKHVVKNGKKFSVKGNVEKPVSNTYPRFNLELNHKKAEYSDSVIKPNENMFSRIDNEFQQSTNIQTDAKLSGSHNISNKMTPPEEQMQRKRTSLHDEETDEKRRKIIHSEKSNFDTISNNNVSLTNIFNTIEQKQCQPRSFEFTLFTHDNDHKNIPNLEIISNQKLQNNFFNINEIHDLQPKLEKIQRNYTDNSRNINSYPPEIENSNQTSAQASSAYDTENSTMSFQSYTKYHPIQHATITHQFFDESTNLDTDIFNIPKNMERNIYKLGDVAGIIIEYTLRRTNELCQKFNTNEHDAKLIVHCEASYIKQMLSILQNVHSEIIENIEYLFKYKNVRAIPRELIKYISEQNRKILYMINTEQELLKQISYKLYN